MILQASYTGVDGSNCIVFTTLHWRTQIFSDRATILAGSTTASPTNTPGKYTIRVCVKSCCWLKPQIQQHYACTRSSRLTRPYQRVKCSLCLIAVYVCVLGISKLRRATQPSSRRKDICANLPNRQQEPSENTENDIAAAASLFSLLPDRTLPQKPPEADFWENQWVFCHIPQLRWINSDTLSKKGKQPILWSFSPLFLTLAPTGGGMNLMNRAINTQKGSLPHS